MNSSPAQNQGELNRQLIDALTHGDTETALVLVNAGADPNTRCEPDPVLSPEPLLKQHLQCSPGSNNPTAFMLACGSTKRLKISGKVEENLSLLQAMLAHGADVNAREFADITTLQWAVMAKRVNTVELLLQHGADINAQDETGYTALMDVASYYAHSSSRLYSDQKLLRLLLVHGADPNIQDGDGYSALHYAVGARYAENVIPDLLAHGADPNLPDKDGYTPLQLAEQRKRSNLVSLLQPHGAK